MASICRLKALHLPAANRDHAQLQIQARPTPHHHSRGRNGPSHAVVLAFGVALHPLRQRNRLCQARGSGHCLKSRPDWTDLPPYCGAVSSETAEVIVVGVAHADGGASGRAVRSIVDGVAPDVCAVELDRSRLSGLVASRRGLPWAYAPKRREGPRPPASAEVRNSLFQGLRLASGIAGVEERGVEFYDAVEAAEDCDALVVPADLPVADALDCLAGAMRWGVSNPAGQIVAGLVALGRAVGSLSSRPSASSGPVRSCGIALPEALLSEGGSRLSPLVRSTLLVVGFSTVLSALLQLGQRDTQASPNFDVGLTVSLLLLLLLGAVLACAFVLSFIRDRDNHMVAQLTGVLEAFQREGVMRCRWTKRTLAFSQDVAGTEQNGPAAVGKVGAAKQAASGLLQPLALPVHVLTDEPAEGQTGWQLVFTAKRPLLEGQLRRLSLFEPRLLRAMDKLVASSVGASDLSLVLVHALQGSERPVALAAPGRPEGKEPPLSVEVDALLEAEGRVAKVDKMWETRGQDGRRRWRLMVKGTSQTLQMKDCGLAADELGALWATSPTGTSMATSSTEPKQQAETNVGGTTRPVRCVAVVGLLHVNGVVAGLQRQLGQSVVP